MLSSRVLLVACALIALCIGAPTSFMSLPYIANMRLHPFSDQNVPLAAYSLLDGATVAIEYGFNPGFDMLMLDYEGAFPITATFSSQNGIMYLSGTAPISEYAAAIKSVVFTTSSTDGANRLITFTYGQNTTYASSTQHFYRYVLTPGNPWNQAMQDCSARTYMGMQGYLATITSQREMEEVAGRTLFSSWLGATSQGGVWTWVAGPEGQENNGQGRQFWTGGDLYSGGSTPDWLTFSQWARFRPVVTNTSFLTASPPTFHETAYFADKLNTDFVGGWICEFGGLDSAAVSANAWQYTGSVTLKFECGLFSSTTECANHASQGCSWSNGQCAARDCGRFLLQSTCVSDWRCNWFVNGEFGVCANTECGQYANNDACVADSGCRNVTVGGSFQCLAAICGDKKQSDTCSSMTGCTWTGLLCINDASAGCNGMDIVYLVDGTVNMSQAFERYPNGFVGVMQALSNADLSLTGTTAATEETLGTRVAIVQFGGATSIYSPVGVGSGGSLTGNRAELQGDIKFHTRAYTASVTTRRLNPAMLKAQGILSSSTRKKIVIVIASGAITDAATAAQTAARIAGATIIGVVLRPTEPQNPDSIDAANSLKIVTPNIVNATLTTFVSQVVYGTCGNVVKTTGAFISATFAKAPLVLCNFATPSTCNLLSSCAWNPAANDCGNSGCLAYSPSACVKDPSCYYSNGMCLEMCADTSYASCTQDVPRIKGLCYQNTSGRTCVAMPCVGNPNEDACIADMNTCVYNPNRNLTCFNDVCSSITDQRTCNTAGCSWSQTGNCFINNCKASTTQALCIKYAECNWNNGTCSLTTCGNHVNEQNCNSDAFCIWDVTMAPAGCAPAPCRDIKSASACSARPECFWETYQMNNFVDMCILRPCYASRTAGDCAKYDGCVWTNSTCKDTTFVQCPAMDVVFLVEATPPMSKSFGRHPNGFSGIVEAIRSWSRNVPMSPTVQQPGFRLAIAGYGYPTASLVPSASIGGQTFCNNASQFTGVQKILDNFASQQASYAAQFTTPSVAVLSGLQTATTLFNSTQSGRKRILMILGHGAITDGSTGSVAAAITALESLGVQIFSNVIRRFSVITPAEEVAAAFLKPLASDPVETHYSFSTIDDMQMLLESFCDPSTTIGTALAVSRDGTLPCNWLTGVTECNMQGSCYWNSTALPTCPLAGQCPNLGCVALPPALAGQFECKHCSYAGGMFSCDRSKSYAAAAGVCLKTPCSLNSLAQCSTGCQWNGATQQCQKEMCASATALECNTDSGCVWDGTSCRRSVCGPLRDSTECGVFPGVGQTPQCIWNATVTPAVCMERRCGFLVTASACNQFPTNCVWEINRCSDRQCQYSDAERCNSDSSCFWDPYARLPGQTGSCNVSSTDCQVTAAYSAWTPCSANCGSGAVSYSSRAILHFEKPGGRACGTVAATLTPPGLTRVWQCNATTISNISGGAITTWQDSCDSYCVQFSSSVSSCISDISCQWKDLQCVPRVISGCGIISNQTACDASDMCTWDTDRSFCSEKPKACPLTTSQTCNNAPNCAWRSGSNTNALANLLGVGAQLLNPGQPTIHVFPTLSINSNDIINGATVTIENGYQLGKDLLQMNLPTVGITTQWMPSSGTLVFSGASSATEYGNAIRAVTFYTSSLSSIARNVTWALGSRTVYSANTGHFYSHFSGSNVSWDTARFLCASTNYFGYSGYLATVTSAAENSIIATKLGGYGWLSGDDGARGSWEWSTGPEAQSIFWIGGSSLSGGVAAYGSFANWNSMLAEPVLLNTGYSHVYLNQSGFWSAKVTTDASVVSFVCEFGGLNTDTPSTAYPFGGGEIIGVGGCVPTTPCIYHSAQSLCEADSQCSWSSTKSSCVVGCGAFATVTDCSSGPNCFWDSSVLPPVCSANSCLNLGKDACSALSQCIYQSSTGCGMKTGCAKFQTEATCNSVSTCMFSGGACLARPCAALNSKSACATNPLCEYTGTACSSVKCKSSVQTDCLADSTCIWSSSDYSSVPFNPAGLPIQPFVNLTNAPTDISLTVDGITVMISKGFQVGNDVLTINAVDNVAGYWVVSWDAANGVLTLRVAPGVTMRASSAFSFLKNSVRFFSTSTSQLPRTLSYVLAYSALYSQSTNTMYRTSPTFVTTYSRARDYCQSTNLFGAIGSVAAIFNMQDNLALRALGATGFIGVTSSNGLWSFNGNISTAFWQGSGNNGVQLDGMFSTWAAGEPLASSSNAVLNPSGSWKSVPSNNMVNYGIICQFNVANNQTFGYAVVKPSGCFAAPCKFLDTVGCAADPQCTWSSSSATPSCVVDTFCAFSGDINSCLQRELCYWDYTYGSCRSQASTVCNQQLGTSACVALPQCVWSSSGSMVPRNSSAAGFCRSAGCGSYPNSDSCNAVASCRWTASAFSLTGTCMGRVCGYSTPEQCWSDSSCKWDSNTASCRKSPCTSTSGQCGGDPSCGLVNGSCVFQRCSSASRVTCLSDPQCLYTAAGTCIQTTPLCSSITLATSCNANPQCFWSLGSDNKCLASQCQSYYNQTECSAQAKAGCQWAATTTGAASCQLSQAALSGSAASITVACTPGVVSQVVFNPPWWLWVLMGLDFLLLVGIIWRIFLAFSAGLTFFTPVRRTKKYDYSKYAADLFSDAQGVGEEYNAKQYGRPTLNDL